MIIKFKIYLLLVLKAIFKKVSSNFPEIEKNVIVHGNPFMDLKLKTMSLRFIFHLHAPEPKTLLTSKD